MKVVVSDFLSPGDDVLNPNDRPEWERSLRRLSVRNQVLCIEVVDAAELDFPDVGDVMVRDPETSFAHYVNTADKATRERMNAASAPSASVSRRLSDVRGRTPTAAHRLRLGYRYRTLRPRIPAHCCNLASAASGVTK